MNRQSSRIGIGGGGAIERPFERPEEALVRRPVWPRRARRRHGTGTELLDDLLPAGRIASHVADVHGIERQSGCLQPAVVTGDAVAVECLADFIRCRGADGRGLLGLPVRLASTGHLGEHPQDGHDADQGR